MKNSVIIKKISDSLMKTSEVEFAFIFGSVLSGKTRYGSDLDIAVYFKNEPDILYIGELVNMLEEITGQKIDLVKLNNLNKNNPALAYSILSTGELIFTEDVKLFNEFKKSVILYYLDFDYSRNLLDKAFNKRLSTKTFAVFDK